jgi:hypothetical protein
VQWHPCRAVGGAGEALDLTGDDDECLRVGVAVPSRSSASAVCRAFVSVVAITWPPLRL